MANSFLELPDWESFKDLCIATKNLNNQYAETADRYELYGPDANGIIWRVSLLKETPRNTSQIDFEDNHKQLFNWAIGNRQYTFSTPDFVFNGSSILATATKNSTTNIDFQVPGTSGTFQYINGAIVITTDAVFGDYASSVIIDKDNILGYGANTVLAIYVNRWYINPSQQLDIATPYAGKLLAGLYIRVSYTSVGVTVDPKVAINYRIHTPI